MPHATRDGLSLYYEQAGQGDPPIVFVHGWCCNHRFFQPQYDYFQPSHNVISIDLRGHGRSSRPADGYDIPTLADDVAWFCAEQGIDNPVIIGHSLGGAIGIDLAARYPSLPVGIVAVDPTPCSPIATSLAWLENLERELEGPTGEMSRRNAILSMFSPTVDSERSRQIVETMCTVPPSIAAAMIRGMIAWKGIKAFVGCQTPVLALLASTGGSNDPARLLAIKPDVHIGVTVGAGHFNHLEVPEQVNPMIERFLQVAVAA